MAILRASYRFGTGLVQVCLHVCVNECIQVALAHTPPLYTRRRHLRPYPRDSSVNTVISGRQFTRTYGQSIPTPRFVY